MSLNVMWENETIYAVMLDDPDSCGCCIIYSIYGLTKNKEHADAIAKEVGGYVEETKWISEWT